MVGLVLYSAETMMVGELHSTSRDLCELPLTAGLVETRSVYCESLSSNGLVR